MLAYRHAFHAGNHGDVLKHVVLVALLRHLGLKDKGWRYIDTHAGAGSYDLGSAEAAKRGEFRQGIGALWGRTDLPPPVADYLALVRRLNPDGALRRYPGSPWFAQALRRPQDELRLFELHPTDHPALVQAMAGQRGIQVGRADGFAALKGQLPPPTRRALVLIDPSYEGRGDYPRAVQAVRDALRRFADGVYMVWYPIVSKPGAAAMVQQIRTLAPRGWLQAALTVQPLDALGFGLAGSGVLVLHPPHTLAAALQDALPWLARALAQFDGAGWQLEHDLR
jgi:23S rRNA (adenine2030-N6)-methyltransferase